MNFRRVFRPLRFSWWSQVSGKNVSIQAVSTSFGNGNALCDSDKSHIIPYTSLANSKNVRLRLNVSMIRHVIQNNHNANWCERNCLVCTLTFGLTAQPIGNRLDGKVNRFTFITHFFARLFLLFHSPFLPWKMKTKRLIAMYSKRILRRNNTHAWD